MYKLIVTDLDRTLLHTDKTVSTYTADVLRRCRAQGILLAFATARPKRAIQQYLDILTPDVLIILNGAGVYVQDECIARFGIAPHTRDEVLQRLTRHFPSATISVEIEDILYGNSNLFDRFPPTGGIRTDFSDLPSAPADKILIGISSVEEMTPFMPFIPDGAYIEMSSGDDTIHLALIMNRAATKWAGVQAAAQRLGIAPAHIVAFGDDYNDVSMLQNCGTGIAVANAIPEAKAAADFICDTNNNDGVAKWLEEHVLYPVD